MVRNRRERIEAERKLPRVHVNMTTLQFNQLESIRYNQLVGLLLMNLIGTK